MLLNGDTECFRCFSHIPESSSDFFIFDFSLRSFHNGINDTFCKLCGFYFYFRRFKYFTDTGTEGFQ